MAADEAGYRASFPDDIAALPRDQGEAWLRYLAEAVYRETGGRPRLPRMGWVRFLFEFSRDFDPFVVACALDFLALRWRSVIAESAVDEDASMLDPRSRAVVRAMLGPFRSLAKRTGPYWRHAWLSRLCRSEDEARYCRKWLGAIEDGMNSFEVVNHEMVQEAEDALVLVEPALRKRSRAAFALHYLRELVEEGGP